MFMEKEKTRFCRRCDWESYDLNKHNLCEDCVEELKDLNRDLILINLLKYNKK